MTPRLTHNTIVCLFRLEPYVAPAKTRLRPMDQRVARGIILSLPGSGRTETNTLAAKSYVCWPSKAGPTPVTTVAVFEVEHVP